MPPRKRKGVTSTAPPIAGSPIGRRSLLEPKRLWTIVQATSAGNYLGAAAAFGGVSESTVQVWMRRGRNEQMRVESEGHEPVAILDEVLESYVPLDAKNVEGHPVWRACPEEFDTEEWMFSLFVHLVQRARGQAEVRAVSMIQSAMPNSWQAAAWWLERTRPQDYGRRDKVSHEGVPGGAPIGMDVSVTTDALEEKLALLLEQRKPT